MPGQARGLAMDLEQVDRICDLYEVQLKAGGAVSVGTFLEAQQLRPETQLVAELERLEREYRNGAVGANGFVAGGDALRVAEVAPSGGGESIIGSYKLLQKLGE